MEPNPGDTTGHKSEKWNRVFENAGWLTAIAMALIHLVYMFFPLWSFSSHTILHVTMALAVTLLHKVACVTRNLQRAVLCLLLVLGLSSNLYIALEAKRLEMNFGVGMTMLDFAVGLAVVGVVLILTLMLWGRTIPLLALIAILYFFFGHNIPGVLGFPVLGRNMVMAYLGMGLSAGIYGYLLPISASLVFYFMLFGGIMGVTGMLPMFLETGKWLGRGARGGGAYTAIVGSSLIGTVTGATVANVAFTGQYTIPTMKAQGFDGPSASAVESVASMGGQILPPVMGAGALIMSVIVGVPYITICQKAVLPALLYYAAVTIATRFMIHSLGIGTIKETVNKRLIFERLHVFFVPLAVLIYLLIIRYSPGFAITIALFTCVAASMVLRSTRPSLRGLLNGLAVGAKMGSEMAVAIMTIAIIAQVAITTALGPKIGHAMMSLTGEIVPLSLLVMMVLCIFLGMGMPTVAAYTMVAIVAVPGLAGLGVDKFAAHFFAFYFAIIAAVTPPVATAAIVGSKITESDFWACAIQGFKLALPVFVIPFALVSEPTLLDFPYFGKAGISMMIAAMAFIFALSTVIHRYFVIRMNRLDLVFASACCVTSVSYIMLFKSDLLILASVGLLAILGFRQRLRKKALTSEA
jgi:TRAP transporter 4TM/12TM fusion protein